MNTTRRYYLDKFMEENNILINGDILDIGGVRGLSRGNYKYSEYQENKRKVLNIIENANPDYLISIEEDLNLSAKFDTFIVNEVIEYIDDLDILFMNILKVSNKRITLIMTWPWMNTFHGDRENDLKRYSKYYILRILEKYNFRIQHIDNNGGLFSVIWDFLHTINNHNNNFLLRKLFRVFLFLTFKLSIRIDKIFNTSNILTTGFTMVAIKSDN